MVLCNHEGCDGALCGTGRILKLTAICIVNQTEIGEGVVPSDPEAIAAFTTSHAPHVAQIGLEAGATATWLWTEPSTAHSRPGPEHICLGYP
jgi:hypothetical protein